MHYVVLSVVAICLFCAESAKAAPTQDLLRTVSLLHHASYCGNVGITQAWDCPSCKNPQISGFVLDAKFYNKSLVMFGFVGHMGDTIYAVFRGTVSTSAVSWILNDFRIKQVPFSSKNSARSPRVHLGFLEAYRSISDAFIEGLKTARENCLGCTRTVVTGHSLGGAVATIASLYVAEAVEMNKADIHLITSGGPRVGNLDFVSDVLDSCGEAWRMVEENDPVPHVPPTVRNALASKITSLITGVYVHFPRELWHHNGVYRVCSATTGEDPTCSASVVLKDFSVKDHTKFGGFVNASDGKCERDPSETTGFKTLFKAEGEVTTYEEDVIMLEAVNSEEISEPEKKQGKFEEGGFVAVFFICVGSALAVGLLVTVGFVQALLLHNK